MKKILCLLLILAVSKLQSQELFVSTEPASNMPAKSIGLRLSDYSMKEKYATGNSNRLVPEIMWGVNKHLMLHAEGFISNRNNNNLSAEGIGFYGKYRFLSNDKVHSHFRMAAFGRYSFNNSSIQQEEIATNGFNTGYQLGLIATQLLHKTALSSTISYEQAFDNGSTNKFPVTQSATAINYTFSAGHLFFPKQYTNYKQVNFNMMVELLGQTLTDNGKSFLDIAPAAQFIFNSQLRIDVGYRAELYSSMYRTAPNGFLFRVEYLLFNAL